MSTCVLINHTEARISSRLTSLYKLSTFVISAVIALIISYEELKSSPKEETMSTIPFYKDKNVN